MLHPRLLQVLTHSCPTRRSSDLFERHYRYTGSALTSDSAWLFGAGFAPFWALVLAAYFGILAAGLYLLSGALATLIALWISKTLATGRFEDRSEEHTSELQSLMRISYAVFCLKKKNHRDQITHCTA